MSQTVIESSIVDSPSHELARAGERVEIVAFGGRLIGI